MNETLIEWAKAERNASVSILAARNRLPSNNDLPRSRVSWYRANAYARIGLGEDMDTVLREETAALLKEIRAYNAAQERTWNSKQSWHPTCQGYYGEEQAEMDMLYVRRRITSLT